MPHRSIHNDSKNEEKDRRKRTTGDRSRPRQGTILLLRHYIKVGREWSVIAVEGFETKIRDKAKKERVRRLIREEGSSAGVLVLIKGLSFSKLGGWGGGGGGGGRSVLREVVLT